DQGRDPTGKIRIGRPDMRVQRLHGQQITDGCKLHIDDEHRDNEPMGNSDRITDDLRYIKPDNLPKSARNDGNHEREEEPLYRPCAQVMIDLLRIIFSARFSAPQTHDKLTKMPGTVTRFGKIAVEPQHIRHG